ncbi:hypothetical protein DL764_001791 [Monosporascus ibericus]|uniref:Uncharacterized protein n=1 Tax=Monosporascus ibericus TaxID=155417 RepID=A0A4Q4TT56_9PEZI|nr:hypothetical protein DL764_001791 [Monosporascus ibericus]
MSDDITQQIRPEPSMNVYGADGSLVYRNTSGGKLWVRPSGISSPHLAQRVVALPVERLVIRKYGHFQLRLALICANIRIDLPRDIRLEPARIRRASVGGPCMDMGGFELVSEYQYDIRITEPYAHKGLPILPFWAIERRQWNRDGGILTSFDQRDWAVDQATNVVEDPARVLENYADIGKPPEAIIYIIIQARGVGFIVEIVESNTTRSQREGCD